ncbi:AAA family ATPase [Clostridium sp. UBA7503]|uniref:AAA family ATPase n=1 Tax=Clostridium sp. UBA7503 TaxID=1946377 RepID=UPI003217768F
MDIEGLIIEGFKRFNSKTVFDFSNSKNINTISGKNGSGKTTIADALLLIQQSIFLKLLKEQYSNNSFTKLVEKNFAETVKAYMCKNNLTIELKLKDGDDNIDIVFFAYESELEISWEILFNQGEEILLQYWNLHQPNNIIMFVGSNKYYNEKNIKFSDLNIETSYTLPVDREIWLTLNMIFFPNNTFNLLYQNLFKDWAYERLIPTKGRIDLYFKLSQGFVKNIFENLQFSNFSANKFKENEVVHLVSNKNTGSKKYDMRQLSSGEKTILYSFMYLNLVQRVSVMIIDEPENNLHEEVICKLLNILKLLTNKERTFIETLEELNFEENIIDKVKKYNKKLNSSKIGQVFLFTHSKSLIYSTFEDGSNYVLDDTLKFIDYDECEKKLREVGISALYNRVLFVEGKTEVELFSVLTQKNNIRIEKIENCDKLVATYRCIKEVEHYVNDLKFIFLMDSDESNIKKVNDIIEARNQDFILLDRHEIENYLIDIPIWVRAAKKFADETIVDEITESYISDELYNAAKTQMDNFKKQYISYGLNNMITSIIQVNHRDIPLGNEAYSKFVDGIINKRKILDYIEQCKKIFEECNNKFNDESFNEDWIKVCPGKQVINIAAARIGRKIGVSRERLIKEVRILSNSDKNSPLYKLIHDIEDRLK